MRPTDLPIALKNSGLALEELVPAVVRGPPHRRAYLRVSQLYRRLGAGTLLLTGDPALLFGYLFKSGRAFADFCARAESSEVLGSAFAPALDLMVCRDEEGVRVLAKHLPAAANPAKEYEEDFYYFRILVGLYLDRQTGPQLEAWFAEYEKLVAAGGGDDHRLDLCRALLARVPSEVEPGLLAAAEHVQRDAKRRYDEERWEMDEGNIFSRVSIEVLAWMEIAQRLGVPAVGALPMAPALARPAARIPLPPVDAWRTPERFGSLPS